MAMGPACAQYPTTRLWLYQTLLIAKNQVPCHYFKADSPKTEMEVLN